MVALGADPVPGVELAVGLHLVDPDLLERDGQLAEDRQVVRDVLHALRELHRQRAVLLEGLAPGALDLRRVRDEEDPEPQELRLARQRLVDDRLLVRHDLVRLDFLHHRVDQPRHDLRLLDLHVVGQQVDDFGHPLRPERTDRRRVDVFVDLVVVPHQELLEPLLMDFVFGLHGHDQRQTANFFVLGPGVRLQLVVNYLVVRKDDVLLLEVEHQHVTERTLVSADALLQRNEADVVVDGHAERLHAVLDDWHIGRLGQLRLLHLDVPQLARLVHELAEVLVLA